MPTKHVRNNLPATAYATWLAYPHHCLRRRGANVQMLGVPKGTP